MGGKNTGGGGGRFQIPGTPLPQSGGMGMGGPRGPAAPRGPRGRGDRDFQLQGSQGPSAPSGQYGTLNAAIAESIATEAAKGALRGATVGSMIPGIGTFGGGVAGAGRGGYREHERIRGEQIAPSGTPTISASEKKKGGVFGGLLDEDEDEDTFGGRGESTGTGGGYSTGGGGVTGL